MIRSGYRFSTPCAPGDFSLFFFEKTRQLGTTKKRRTLLPCIYLFMRKGARIHEFPRQCSNFGNAAPDWLSPRFCFFLFPFPFSPMFVHPFHLLLPLFSFRHERRDRREREGNSPSSLIPPPPPPPTLLCPFDFVPPLFFFPSPPLPLPSLPLLFFCYPLLHPSSFPRPSFLIFYMDGSVRQMCTVLCPFPLDPPPPSSLPSFPA